MAYTEALRVAPTPRQDAFQRRSFARMVREAVTPEMMQRLVQMLYEQSIAFNNIEAAKVLLNYTCGKPVNTIETEAIIHQDLIDQQGGAQNNPELQKISEISATLATHFIGLKNNMLPAASQSGKERTDDLIALPPEP